MYTSAIIFTFLMKLVIDLFQIYKPMDEGYDEFWIDFNIGSKRISIFCEPTLLSSQVRKNQNTI